MANITDVSDASISFSYYVNSTISFIFGINVYVWIMLGFIVIIGFILFYLYNKHNKDYDEVHYIK